MTLQENTEKEEIGLASPRLGANNSNNKPPFVTAFLQTSLSAKKDKGSSGSVTLVSCDWSSGSCKSLIRGNFNVKKKRSVNTL